MKSKNKRDTNTGRKTTLTTMSQIMTSTQSCWCLSVFGRVCNKSRTVTGSLLKTAQWDSLHQKQDSDGKPLRVVGVHEGRFQVLLEQLSARELRTWFKPAHENMPLPRHPSWFSRCNWKRRSFKLRSGARIKGLWYSWWPEKRLPLSWGQGMTQNMTGSRWILKTFTNKWNRPTTLFSRASQLIFTSIWCFAAI